ncbi:NAD-dependent epimerase/dehydratase family protein [Brevundimonas poindexterae]|uniref:NAD-dependent epimerase/dehydratase family protein n=1 Tax=Brevundimonas poindexterae TaxID=74325 RepID=UPI001CFD8915|nr:NAD-dependent epimerase/dehydratase family protein [Brevundimonas poindexterae]
MPSALERVGIIGATGYIGSRLASSLQTEGFAPRLFGRRSGVVGGAPVEVLTKDPTQFSGLDCLVHLSAIAHRKATEAEMHQANATLVAEVVELAMAARVKRFIFVSSIAVHGQTSASPVSPESPCNPVSAYGRSKLAAERYLKDVTKRSALEVTILRPPMIYGPGCKGNFPLLAKLVCSGLPLPFGKAKAERSFCSIDSLISALRHVIVARVPVRCLIPADPGDFDTAGLITVMGEAMNRRVRLWPVPRALLEISARAVGKEGMITSLFDPLQVDRDHWQDSGWLPVEQAREAVRAAISESASTPSATT